ncbi:vWA domain-containing protein [Nocardioides speluncae]|uniref:vWA domain-containing protein n=1 Tax=Nocardioides speluncae TaxID=2670337 RepID=UPI000D688C54|nr:von Willebrand factor type A domain-containing protein [Nocardioides speluncae]
MRRHHLIATAALIGLMTAGLTACSGDDSGDDAQPSAEAGDPQDYYDDYDDQDPPGIVEPAPPGNWPGVMDENTFVEAGTSGFVATELDPRSTFSLEGDTGSYAIARGLMAGGNQPPPEAIRPEEWVNAFDYGYAAPLDRDLGVYVDSAAAPYALDDTRLVRVGIKAREISAEDRPPAAITMVVDTSGSMDIRTRLGLVKSSLALLAENLRPTDTVAIVTRGSGAQALLPPTPVRDGWTIQNAIRQLYPSGSTNMEAGLQLGYQHARASFREGGINTVILASDGVANVGSTTPEELVGMIRENGSEGIHLVTVGYGMGNYNDHLMEQLADDGDGFYAYVDTYEEAQKLYVTDLAGTLAVVAEEARAQVWFDPELVASYRLIGYENRDLADESFTSTEADAGEIGSGHDVTALYEVQLTSAARAGDRVGSVHLAWRPAGSSEFEQSATPVYADAVESPSSALRLASTVADVAQVLKGGTPLTERGVTLTDLAADAAALEAEDVAGARELSALIADAKTTCYGC